MIVRLEACLEGFAVLTLLYVAEYTLPSGARGIFIGLEGRNGGCVVGKCST